MSNEIFATARCPHAVEGCPFTETPGYATISQHLFVCPFELGRRILALENTVRRLEMELAEARRTAAAPPPYTPGGVGVRYAVIGSTQLRIREGPSTDCAVRGLLEIGETITAIGEPVRDRVGNKWIRHSRGFSMAVDVAKVKDHYLTKIN